MSAANGDFVGTGVASSSPVFMMWNNVPSVYFNGTAAGKQQYMTSSPASIATTYAVSVLVLHVQCITPASISINK